MDLPADRPEKHKETCCHRFAGAFLYPGERVRADFGSSAARACGRPSCCSVRWLTWTPPSPTLARLWAPLNRPRAETSCPVPGAPVSDDH